MRMRVYGVLIPEPIIEKVQAGLKELGEFTFQEAMALLKQHKLSKPESGYPSLDIIYYKATGYIFRRFRGWGWMEGIKGTQKSRWVK